MPRVSWLAHDWSLASARYRHIIPSRALEQMGVRVGGNEVLIVSKHGWDWDEVTRGFKRVVMDVCDDHFGNPALGQHYLDACARADAVTCNSREMARVIKTCTDRDAWVIPDPYEQPERAPRVGNELLWFGHALNLPDLRAVMDSIAEYPLQIVTGGLEGVCKPPLVQWSPQAMDAAYEACGMVIIPTGKSMAKSGNRAIESIRRGRFPVCGYLPAYADLGVWVGDIADGVDWALSHPGEVVKRIGHAQAYVRKAYSPQRIAEQWLEVLQHV
jgi:hypothetical protein